MESILPLICFFSVKFFPKCDVSYTTLIQGDQENHTTLTVPNIGLRISSPLNLATLRLEPLCIYIHNNIIARSNAVYSSFIYSWLQWCIFEQINLDEKFRMYKQRHILKYYNCLIDIIKSFLLFYMRKK